MATKKLHSTLPQIERLYDRGVKSVIPLFQGKSPGYGEWQKMPDEEAQEKAWSWKPKDGEHLNFGLRLGPQWGDLCDIDLDSAESRLLAKYYLPETACFGRGGVVTHYLYIQTGAAKEKVGSKRYQWDKRDEKSVLLEFRASGQTMGPGSTHPNSGETIEWMNDSEIRTVEGVDLVRAVNKLAAASMLLRDWESGGRDELAVCLVGSMVRGGWDDSEIDHFLEGILVESGDEESGKRLKAERLREQLGAGGRVPGLKRLRELCSGGGLGVAGFERIVEWLELGGGDIIEEINKEYAVVVLPGGGVALMKESEERVEFMDKRSFSLLFANRMVPHRGKEMTADKFWLSHGERREYLRGVVFKPGQEVREGEYNLWKGFTVDPVEDKGEGWSLFRGHLRDVVCSGDVEVFEWLMGWLAHRVQRPWEVPQSAVVLVGERGDGKSSVFKIFGRLFGRHYMTVTNPRHFMGNFNSHMMDKVLVLADEAVWGGDKVNEGILKVMISEDRRVIEIKGRDAFEVDNCTGYGICSNNDWVVPVGRQERRFLILRTSGEKQGDFGYWDALYDAMDLGSEEGRRGLGSMLAELRSWDLAGKGWRGNRPPATSEMKAQQTRGMEHWVQFVVWKMESGGGWVEEIWCDHLYEEYRSWVSKMGWRADTEGVFGVCLERMFGVRGLEKIRGKRVEQRFEGRAGISTTYVKRNKWRFLGGEKGIKERVGKFIHGAGYVE